MTGKEPEARGMLRSRMIEMRVIQIPPGRDFDEATVTELTGSMTRVGLLNPITVQFEPGSMQTTLVAGRNRLEAARRLGWSELQAIELPRADEETDADLAALAEIVENLHRREIGRDERDGLIRRYAEVLDAAGDQSRHGVAIESKRADGKGHRPEGPASRIAAELGVGKRTVQRALSSKRADTVEAAGEKGGRSRNGTEDVKLLKQRLRVRDAEVNNLSKALLQVRNELLFHKAAQPAAAPSPSRTPADRLWSAWQTFFEVLTTTDPKVVSDVANRQMPRARSQPGFEMDRLPDQSSSYFYQMAGTCTPELHSATLATYKQHYADARLDPSADARPSASTERAMRRFTRGR